MILILTQCFPSRVGGIESLMSNLAIELSKKEKTIIFADQHHLFYDAIYDNDKKDVLNIRRTRGIKFFRRRRKVREMIPFIESKQVRLVIADSWKSFELPIEYLNKNKIPTICLAHGNELIENNIRKKNKIKNIFDKVNMIVANSEFTSNLAKKFLKNRNNIKFIYPGANDLRNILSDSFIDIKGSPVIVTLARLEKRKGHVEIIKTVKKLTKIFPNIQYIIAGEGSEKSNLIKIVKENALENNVLFVGLVNESQKSYLFKNSDLMVMPTLDESNQGSIEGFGIVYLEAAFFGIPSIASDVGGTKEAVLHDKTGIIIKDIDDLYFSIYELLTNKEKRISLGKQAQKRAIQYFSWKHVADKYLNAINK